MREQSFAQSSNEGGRLPLPIGERGGVRGFRSLDKFEPPHPNPLPSGERESVPHLPQHANILIRS